jgi:hypothetical protein
MQNNCFGWLAEYGRTGKSAVRIADFPVRPLRCCRSSL